MNTNTEVERIVSDWLEDRVADPPHGSLRSALARAGQTPQQRHRWLPRWFGRGRGTTGGVDVRDRDDPTNDRRNRLMFSATAMAAGVATLALVATLVVPQGAGEPVPVPGAGGATHRVAADGPREEIVVEFPDGGPAQVFEDDDEPYLVSFPVVLQASDATLRGLTIRMPPEGGGAYAIGGEPTFADLSVVPHPDVQFSGDDSDPELMALEFGEGSSPFVRDSSWHGWFYSGESSPTIEGNTVTAG